MIRWNRAAQIPKVKYACNYIGVFYVTLLRVGQQLRVNEGLVNSMQVQDLNEMGSFARFFLEMLAMFLVVATFAFCLIAVAYADDHSPTPQAPIAEAWWFADN